MQTFKAGLASEGLDLLKGSGLLEQGCVNLVSVEAVRARSEDRWPRKRELVHDFVDKKLKERLAPGDLVTRVNDTDYLIAVATDHPSAAQAVCLRVLEEVLLHFIGRVDRGDIVLKRVDDISGEMIVCSPIDLARVPRFEGPAPTAVERMKRPTLNESDRNPVLFSSLSGRPLRIDFTPRAVTRVSDSDLAALHMDRTVAEEATGQVLTRQELEALTDTDIARIDAATVRYAELFTSDSEEAGPTGLIVPVSFRTLHNSRGRQALVAAGAGDKAFKTAAILEMVDLDGGTPAGRLAETAALGRAFARAMFGRAPDGLSRFEALHEARFAGLTTDLRQLAATARAGRVTPEVLCARMLKAARSLVALHAPAELETARLAALGFTHRAGG